MTEQIPQMVFVQTTRRKQPKEIAGVKFQFIKFRLVSSRSQNLRTSAGRISALHWTGEAFALEVLS